MHIRKVKRKCGVRGCKNTESFMLSLNREAGNSVIICKSCLGKALSAVDECEDEAPAPKERKPAPPLFFNHLAQKSTAPAEAEPAEPAQEAESAQDEPTFACQHCGKAFETERGLKQHMKTCPLCTAE